LEDNRTDVVLDGPVQHRPVRAGLSAADDFLNSPMLVVYLNHWVVIKAEIQCEPCFDSTTLDMLRVGI